MTRQRQSLRPEDGTLTASAMAQPGWILSHHGQRGGEDARSMHKRNPVTADPTRSHQVPSCFSASSQNGCRGLFALVLLLTSSDCTAQSPNSKLAGESATTKMPAASSWDGAGWSVHTLGQVTLGRFLPTAKNILTNKEL